MNQRKIKGRGTQKELEKGKKKKITQLYLNIINI